MAALEAEMTNLSSHVARLAISYGTAGLRLCPRRGRYRKDKLMSRFGGDMPMSELRHKIAICPRKEAIADACGVYLPDLRQE